MTADREAVIRERREATCECCRRNDAPQGEQICGSCDRHQDALLAELAAGREQEQKLRDALRKYAGRSGLSSEEHDELDALLDATGRKE